MSLLRSPRRLFLVILALGIFSLAASNLTDPDIWWHLRSGHLIVQNHRVPHTDPFSFTHAGQPWIDHEWLSQVLVYSAYLTTGAGGLIVLFGLVILATQLPVYLRCAAPWQLAGVLTLWGAWTALPAWGARPEMFSLLLGSIFLLLLERSSQSRPLLWWTLPLMLLWVNLHAGYALGLALIFLFLVGEGLDCALGLDSWTERASRFRDLTVAFLTCLAVVPLNPNGMKLLSYPFQTLTSPAMQHYIVEWRSPDFHAIGYAPLLGLLLTLLAALALSPRRVRPGELLLLLTTAAAALHSLRHIPIFTLVAIPILCQLLQPWISRYFQDTSRAPTGFLKALCNAALLVGFTAFAVFRVTHAVRQQPAIEAEKYPAAAVAYIATHDIPGSVFNSYDWGGYFIWRLQPGHRVFVDGRADVYGDQFLEEYAATYGVRDDWQQALQRWRIQIVVIPAGSPLATALLQSGGWHPIYADRLAVILAPKPAQTWAPSSFLRSGSPAATAASRKPGKKPRNAQEFVTKFHPARYDGRGFGPISILQDVHSAGKRKSGLEPV